MMERAPLRFGTAGLALLFLISLATASQGQRVSKDKPNALQNVGVEEHLGDVVPKDTWFYNSKGDTVTIGELLKTDQPVILTPVYYECPMLCNLVLNGVFTGVSGLDWKVGEDYQIITFSFNHREGAELASSNKKAYLDSLGQEGAAKGWHFLTGNEEQIRKLTDAVGFNFKYVPEKNQYAHNAAIMFLSPQGKISRYLYGISYKELDLKNALYDAADGKIGTTVDKILMYCYQYDPSSQSYVPVAFNIMKLGGLATMIILGVFLGILWYKEKRSNKTN